MRYCRECGAEQPEGAAFCVRCGAELEGGAAPGPGQAKKANMSVGAYVGALLLFSIPVAGLVLAIVWACGGTDNPDRRNLARGWLIVALIGAVLGILIAVVVGGLVASMVFGLSAVEQAVPEVESWDAPDGFAEWDNGVWEVPSPEFGWD